jgi:hypothetical protein
MKRYAIRLLLISAMLYTVEGLLGQDLVRKPNSELINSLTEVMGTASYERGTTKWFVFSNRKGCKVYDNTGQVISSDVDFLEEFNVISEENNRVKVKRPNGSEVGWINKEDLILLDHCERKANMVSKKAMIINTLDRTNDINNQYRFFYDANLTQRNMNEKRSVYEILYVYKESDSALLLGKREDCSVDVEKYMKESVIGWIHKKAVTKWDSRGCLLPNYKSEAKTERRTLDIQPAIMDTSARYENQFSLAEAYRQVFMNYSSLQQFAGTFQKNPIVWKEEIDKRWPPSKFRLPYLDKHATDEEIMKVGVLGDITDAQGRQIQTLIDNLREWERQNRTKNSLNLVFVIDGTTSMREYFPAVANAISASQQAISKDPDFSDVDNPNRVTIRCAAVVYRDVPEASYLVETCPLQDFTATKNWIQTNFQDAKNAHDRDIPEAVFYGLYYALEDVLVGHEEENNLIITIGDAGDREQEMNDKGDYDESYIPMDTIIDGLYRKNCNFIAFQTHWKNEAENPANISYTQYCSQMLDICEKSAQKIQTTMEGIRNLDLQGTVKLISESSTASYEIHALDQPFLANKVYCNKGSQLDASKLTSLILDAIKQSSHDVSLVNKFIHEILYSGLSWDEILKKYNMSPTDMANLGPIATTLGYIVGELKRVYPNEDVTAKGGRLEQLLAGKLQLYFEGFTPLKINGSKNNLWTFEILTIAQTKKNLERDYMKVINAFKNQGSADQRRQLIYDAFLTLARTYAGDETNYENLSIGILFAKIIDCPGLKFSSKYRDCLSKTIRQIKLEQECSDECLNIFYNEIYKSYNNIKNLSYQDYVTTAFGTFSAYYIPVELMPFVN